MSMRKFMSLVEGFGKSNKWEGDPLDDEDRDRLSAEHDEFRKNFNQDIKDYNLDEDFDQQGLDEDYNQLQSDRAAIARVDSLEEPEDEDDVMGRFPILTPAHMFDENAPITAEWYDRNSRKRVTLHPNLDDFKAMYYRVGGTLCRGIKNTMMENKLTNRKKAVKK